MIDYKNDASPEKIRSLIENLEKELSQIEKSLPLAMEMRQAIEDDIKKQDGNNVVLDLLLVVFDTILAEDEVIYDLSASLNALLKANNDYTKRYYMQCMNLCFCESCQAFVGQKDDKNGLLQRLKNQCGQLNLVGYQFLINHIIEDIKTFKNEYANIRLRNITRHYDHPIKMYEEVQKLNSIDFFGKGASQLMAIRMEISVISSSLLTLFAPKISDLPQNVSPKKDGVIQMVNEVFMEKFLNKDFGGELQMVLIHGKKVLDGCYHLFNSCQKAKEFLKGSGADVPNLFEKMESLLFLRMEALFLRYDVACSVWGYINASSDMERSQNLRLIHITKQAALTHIYGYTEDIREKSLLAKIKSFEEVDSEKLDTDGVDEKLKELTMDLSMDSQKSRMYTHYLFKVKFYIPDRLDAFGKMLHAKELEDSLKLLHVCKTLDDYTFDLLGCLNDRQKQERKKLYDEWMDKIDQIAAHMSNDNKIKDAIKPMRDLIELAYGDKME